MAAKISPSVSWEDTIIALDNYKYLYYNHGSNVEVNKFTERVSRYINNPGEPLKPLKLDNDKLNNDELRIIQSLRNTNSVEKINFYKKALAPKNLATIENCAMLMAKIYTSKLSTGNKNLIKTARPFSLNGEHVINKFNTIRVSFIYPIFSLYKNISRLSQNPSPLNILNMFFQSIALTILATPCYGLHLVASLLMGIINLVNNVMGQGFVKFQNWSTLKYGNIPYQSENFTINVPDTNPIKVMEMGMPIDILDYGLFSRVKVNDHFKEFVNTKFTKENPYLYVCLLEEKSQESQYIDSLYNFSKTNSKMRFMKVPSKDKVDQFARRLHQKIYRANIPINQQDALKIIKHNIRSSFENDKNDYRFDDKIKAVSNLTNFEQYNLPPNENQPLSLENISDIIESLNAELVKDITQDIKPKMMSFVCKDGIDRGHRFKLKTKKAIEKNFELTDPIVDMRALFAKGRAMNSHNRHGFSHQQKLIAPQSTDPASSRQFYASEITPPQESHYANEHKKRGNEHEPKKYTI